MRVWSLGALLLAGCAVAGPPASSDNPWANTCGDTDSCPPTAPVCYGNSDDSPAPTCVTALTFQPCAADSDCPGPDGFCYGLVGGYATGMCSRPLSLADENSNDPSGCGPGATVGDELYALGDDTFEWVCAPSCRGDPQCADGYACEVTSANGATAVDSGCVVHCTRDEQCPANDCDPYSHKCGTVDTTLQDDGAPCALQTDCRSGLCIPEMNGTAPTGFLDGMCVSYCVQPADADYQAKTLPVADCPDNEACAPSATGGAGYLTQCRPRCTRDSDCRPDYVCNQPPGSLDGFCGIRDDSP